MNRAFFIVGIVFSVIFMFITSYYADEVQSARWDAWDYSYSNYSYDSYDSYSYPTYSSYSYDYSDGLTTEAGFWSLFFFLCFIAIDILGIMKVKTKTMKVLGIIGLSISGIFLLVNFLVIFDQGAVSFDEVAPAWILYCLIMLAFTIVGLVQSVRFYKRQSSSSNVTPVSATTAPSATTIDPLDDLLDD
ncbi:MAG: hypothetical protein P8H56_11470 [Crocinitomicaceae bacterium]|nr:hypothetical protein [Crocinitomicaceae bacterium]MDG1659194.1 hypothetical protein [Crocinitomicaceae bacterium]